ncbi:MAG: circularly permuted type 2 ATP-grasp protein, partial [Terrimicrobiaceae bacterium]
MSAHWHFRSHNETHAPGGKPREVYNDLFKRIDQMSDSQIRALDGRLEATMREMGVTFDIHRDLPWTKRAWFCDLLPQIFTPDEWAPLAAGIRQRLRAFEMFLADIYTEKKILLDGAIPVAPVLGSDFFQRAAHGLPVPGGSRLHMSGIAVCRLPDGSLAAKHHYFANASGISYMVQNRRAL